MVWGTTKEALAGDLVEGIKWVEKHERNERGDASEKTEIVLVGHSSGGGLSQLVLSKGWVRVRALILVGAVPGFGS